MRHLFEQYNQPENRLSHALAVCLNEDRALLQDFLLQIGVKATAPAQRLKVAEQTLPGDAPMSEENADRRGLPDLVIHDDERWCLLIESKVEAPLTLDQLQRHESTIRRRGFESIASLALVQAGAFVPEGISALTWSELYEWLGRTQARGEWSERLRSYLRVAEVRFAQDGYLKSGTLTMFDGFTFSETNPYSYGEAKRLLRLALEKLRRSPELIELGMDPDAEGRSAITGSEQQFVWDFLSLKSRPKKDDHTSYPHLTLALHSDHLEVAITIPNGVVTPVRNRLAELGAEGLAQVNAEILRRSARLIALGATVRAFALQRHYKTQRSAPDVDGTLAFRLETSQPDGASGVKHQPEWVELFALLARQKRSNIQFQYRTQFPWGTEGLDRKESLGLIVESWRAMMPVVEAITGGGDRIERRAVQ